MGCPGWDKAGSRGKGASLWDPGSQWGEEVAAEMRDENEPVVLCKHCPQILSRDREFATALCCRIVSTSTLTLGSATV